MEQTLKDRKRESGRKYYLKNKEKVLVRTRDYYHENKDRSKKWRRDRHLRRKFGITEEEFQKILERQGGGCAICGSKAKEINLQVDHCHRTGQIRGILCSRCNLGVGYFLDDGGLLAEASKYVNPSKDMNLNKCQIIGRVTKDPELKALPSGTQVCSFSLAVNNTYKDKEGNKKEDVEFVNCVAFGKSGEVIAQYMKKGSLLYVEGRIQTRSWEGTDGKKNYRTEIIVEKSQFGPKTERQERASAPADDPGPADIGEREITADEIPF